MFPLAGNRLPVIQPSHTAQIISHMLLDGSLEIWCHCEAFCALIRVPDTLATLQALESVFLLHICSKYK